MDSFEVQDGDYLITTDASRLDVDVIYNYLSQSYWAAGIPRHIVEKSIDNSLCFGVFHQGAQVGFARLITDKATFAYLADVFILPGYRGKGLSKLLMEVIHSHPELQNLRRWMLATRDAHGLYSQFGWQPLTEDSAKTIMLIPNPDVYKTLNGQN